jgi:hypothetical protein
MNLDCGYCGEKLIINSYNNHHYDCHNCNYFIIIENNNCVQYRFYFNFNNLDLYCFSSAGNITNSKYTIIRQIPDFNSILYLNNKICFEDVKQLLFNLLIFK